MSNPLPIPTAAALNDTKGQTTRDGYKFFESLAQSARSLVSNALLSATSAAYQANTAGQHWPSINNLWSAVGDVTLTDAATITINLSTGFNFTVSLGGNRTLGNPSNAKPGQSGCFKVTASGATRTLARDTNYKSTTAVTWPISIASGQTAYVFYFVDTSSKILITSVMNNPT